MLTALKRTKATLNNAYGKLLYTVNKHHLFTKKWKLHHRCNATYLQLVVSKNSELLASALIRITCIAISVNNEISSIHYCLFHQL